MNIGKYIVCMNLTLFYRGTESLVSPLAYGIRGRAPTAFFITDFLICHSFLDFLYMDDWAVGSPAQTLVP